MRIDRVVLPVPDPVASAQFYREVLGLPVRGLVVEVGWSRIELASGGCASQHLAFTVPGDAGFGGRDWLLGRGVALLGEPGEEVFEASPSWDACSVYFEAPDGTVLELIARRRRRDRLGHSTFGPQHLLGVSEVGVPVSSMPQARSRLGHGPGLGVFAGSASTTFTAVGDDEGLLVLVEPGRTWFPTRSRCAQPGGVEVSLSGTRGRGALRLDPGTLVAYR